MALGNLGGNDMMTAGMALGLSPQMAQSRAARMAQMQARRATGSATARMAQLNATRGNVGMLPVEQAGQYLNPTPTLTAQDLASMPPDAASRSIGRMLPSAATPAALAQQMGPSAGGPAVVAQDLVGMTPDAASRALARAGTSVESVAPGVMPPVQALGPSAVPLGPGLPAAETALGPALPAVASPSAAGAVAGAAETAGAKNAGKLATMFGEGGRFAEGSLGRAGLYGAAGVLGGQLVNKVWHNENTSADSALAGAATGAGIGAGIGSFVPIPGVGTGVGALLGGLAGGAIGAFGPKNTGAHAVASQFATESKKLEDLIASSNLDPLIANDLRRQLPAMTYGAQSKADIKTAAQQIAASIPGLMQQQSQAAYANTQQQQNDQNKMMAIQAMFGPMLNDSLAGARTSAANANQEYRHLADNMQTVDPRIADLYRARGATLETAGNNVAAGYAAQAAMAPYTAQQNLADQVVQRTNNSTVRALANDLSAQTRAQLTQTLVPGVTR